MPKLRATVDPASTHGDVKEEAKPFEVQDKGEENESAIAPESADHPKVHPSHDGSFDSQGKGVEKEPDLVDFNPS